MFSYKSYAIANGVCEVRGKRRKQNELDSITIPEGVTTIGNYAFCACTDLTNVYYTGSEEQWNTIEIGDENNELFAATIHYNSRMPGQPDNSESDNSEQAKKVAAAAVEQIRAIGTVTLEKKETIAKARAAYNALTDEAKKYVSDADLKLLTDAEKKYATLKAEKDAADKAAAEKAAAEKKAAEEKAAAEKKAAQEAAKKEAIGAKNVVGNATYEVAKNQTVIYTANKKKNATSVKIPATIKINDKEYKVTEIAASAFKNSKKLTKVTMPKTVKKIGKSAFQNCSALKTVTIGSDVTTIGDGAFQGCSKLTKVTISEKVTKIGKNAFYNCKKLKTIVVKTNSLKSVGKSAFKNIAKSATIKVPKKKLTAYKKLLKKSGLGSKVKIVK